MRSWILFLWFFVEPTTEVDVCSEEFDLRLEPTVSLGAGHAGRLEVCRRGTWGTIRLPSSTVFWPIKNILVACQYLFYPSGLNSIPPIQLGALDQASSNVPVHMESVTCDGTEMLLGYCKFSDVSDSNFHGNDVYIVCSPGKNQSASKGDVRLKGNVKNGHGAVEIFTQFGWTTICPDSSWSRSDATTICRNLGYDSGAVANIEMDPALLVPRMVYDAECLETSDGSNVLFRIAAGICSFQVDSSMCPFPANAFAGVACRAATEELGSVRLFSRTRNADRVRGQVEVLIDSRWGKVCPPTTPETVPAICQGLGYYQHDAMMVAIMPGNQLKPIWYPDLVCVDGSRSISVCNPGSPVGYGVCAQVLAVDCEVTTSTPNVGDIAVTVISLIVVVGLSLATYVCCRPYGTRRLTDHWEHLKCCIIRRRSSRISNCRATTTTAQAPPPPALVAVDSERPRPGNMELTTAPPPTYEAAADLPPDDLPPPYPGHL